MLKSLLLPYSDNCSVFLSNIYGGEVLRRLEGINVGTLCVIYPSRDVTEHRQIHLMEMNEFRNLVDKK